MSRKTGFLSSGDMRKAPVIGKVLCFALCSILIMSCRETHDVFIEPVFKHLDVKVTDVEHYPDVTLDFQAFHVDQQDDNWSNGFNSVFLESPYSSFVPKSSESLTVSPRLLFFAHIGGFSKKELKKLEEGMIAFFDSVDTFATRPEMNYYFWKHYSFIEVSRKSFFASLSGKEEQGDYDKVITELSDRAEDIENSFAEDAVIVVVGKIPVEVQLGSFRRQILEFKQNDHLWWILLTEGTVFLPDEFQDSHCLLIQDIQHEEPFARNIAKKYQLLSRSYGRAVFTIDDPLSFSDTEGCFFSLPRLQLPEVPIEFSFDSVAVRSYAINQMRERAWSLVLRKEYHSALSAYTEYSSYGPDLDDLDSLSKSLVLNWSTAIQTGPSIDTIDVFTQTICQSIPGVCSERWWNDQVVQSLMRSLASNLDSKTGSPDDLLEYENRVSSLIPAEAAWRQDLRLKMLRNLQKRFHMQGESWDLRLIVAEKILEIDPSDPDANFTHFTIRSQNLEHNHQYLDALRSLSRAILYKQSPSLDNEMRRLTTEGFGHYYRNGQDSLLIKLHSEFLQWDADNFANHYYVFIAAENRRNSSLAVTELEWIARNWLDNQEFMTWSALNTKLQEHYLVAGELENSLALTKKLIQDDNSRIDMLGQYFLVHRMIPVKAFVSLLQLIENEKDSERIFQSLFERISVQQLPEYIDYIALIDEPGNVISGCSYHDTPDVVSANSLTQSGQRVVFLSNDDRSSEKLVFMVPIGRMFCVAQINRSLDAKEMTLATDIEQFPQNEARWHILRQHLRKQNRDLFTYLITYALEADGDLDAIKIDSWVAAINSYTELKYFVVQDASGAVVFDSNFSRTEVQYKGNSWTNSSQALALYRSYPLYKDLQLEDIAQPIYGKSLWKGIARFGFELIEE